MFLHYFPEPMSVLSSGVTPPGPVLTSWISFLGPLSNVQCPSSVVCELVRPHQRLRPISGISATVFEAHWVVQRRFYALGLNPKTNFAFPLYKWWDVYELWSRYAIMADWINELWHPLRATSIQTDVGWGKTLFQEFAWRGILFIRENSSWCRIGFLELLNLAQA